MPFDGQDMVDWSVFARARTELGAAFVRILGYFREDGIKSLDAIERAVRERNAAGLIIPAHTLKGEARQFGAGPLAMVAEEIETVARRCVEAREAPDELIERIVELRPLFEATLTLFDQEVRPVVERRPAPGGFGRRTPASFGQAQR